MTIAEEIERLYQLKESGAITEDEYVEVKRHMLAGALPADEAATTPPAELERQTREWAMFLHLSQLLGMLVPLGGLVAPILIWQIKKEALPELDAHGKLVLNWVLSALIYFVVALLLTMILIGIPLLIALVVVSIVFPIIGGVKANNGELWPYPLSIGFLK